MCISSTEGGAAQGVWGAASGSRFEMELHQLVFWTQSLAGSLFCQIPAASREEWSFPRERLHLQQFMQGKCSWRAVASPSSASC